MKREKRFDHFAQKHFTKHPCRICGRPISNCGFAYTAHERMHERKGEIAPSSDSPARPTRRKKKPSAREYKQPKTVAELGITCQEPDGAKKICGNAAEWFDRERATSTGVHLRGVICGDHPRSSHSEKLLVKPASSDRPTSLTSAK